MSDRTFVVKKPTMRGSDVRDWQNLVKAEFKRMKVDCPIVVDGYYGVATRSYSASLLHAFGMTASTVMKKGLTPQTRTRVQKRNFTDSQKKMAQKRRGAYLKKLRARWTKVHPPTNKILADSWGYHPPIHDGIDVITPPDAVIFAMVKCKVIDVRSGGWWGKGAPSPAVAARGDGIIQVEVLETVGPFKKGDHIGYGHAEKAQVKVGQVVEAGKPLGRAGMANAWHIHLMLNNGSTSKGIGNKDPRAILDYSVKHG